MPQIPRHYRSHNSLIGGVCSGIAEYYDIDAVLVRVLAVLLAVLTFGLAIIPYVVLMACWPKRQADGLPLDVDPKLVDSQMFGSARAKAYAGDDELGARNYSERAICVGHEPPVPPRGFVFGEGAPEMVCAAEGAAGQESAFAAVRAPVQTVYGVASLTEPGEDRRARARRNQVSVTVMIFLALSAVTLAISAIADRYVDPISANACWPLFLIFLGLARAFVPVAGRSLTWCITTGGAFVALGVLFLPLSTGVLSWETLLQSPMLVLLLAALLIGDVAMVILKFSRVSVAINLALIAFCAVVLALFAIPGTLGTIEVHLPFIQAFSVGVNPWL